MFYKSFEVSVKAADDDVKDGGEITAYAATFDREPDSYGDVIAKGAFTDTLKAWKESGNSIPLLFGHRTDDPMMNIGAVTDIKEDDTGLLITAKFDPDSEIAQYTRKLVVEKRLTKMSFAYDVEDRGTIELDGMEANELRKLNLYEVSLVPIPANQHAVVVDAKAAALDDAGDGSVADDDVLAGDGDSAPSTGDDASDDTANDDAAGSLDDILEALASLSADMKTSFAALKDAVDKVSAQLSDTADEPGDGQSDDDVDTSSPDDETSDEEASDASTDESDDADDDNEEASDGNSEDQDGNETDDDDEDKKPKKDAGIEAALAKMARYQAL